MTTYACGGRGWPRQRRCGMARISLSAIKINKTFSQETNCFRANLHLDGVKVGTVENDGHGGNDHVWVDPASGVTLDALIEAADADNTARGEESTLGDDLGRRFALEIAVSNLLDRHEEEKFLKRHCKTKLVFRLPEDPVGEWRTMTKPYSEGCKAWVLAKYPNAIIANERVGLVG